MPKATKSKHKNLLITKQTTTRETGGFVLAAKGRAANDHPQTGGFFCQRPCSKRPHPKGVVLFYPQRVKQSRHEVPMVF
ncbi:MAG: hypothetical protein DRG66_08190, partial [Deltaproteobacteria bacterium]